jgi:RNA polymerase-associated protein
VRKKAAKAKKLLRENLIASIPLFESNKYFLSDEFTLVDGVLAPLLWRLPLYGIELPKEAKAIKDYIARVTKRDTFQESMSKEELDMMESHILMAS